MSKRQKVRNKYHAKKRKKSSAAPMMLSMVFLAGMIYLSNQVPAPESKPVRIADIIATIDDTKPVELFSAKDALIDYVMHDIEGGSKYVKDGCGYAKYGINSCYNPDVNVKKLTARKAAKIYVTRYWDERLDSYPPAFQLVAFDALVNHGNDDNTWQMIKAAKASPSKLIKLRKAYYSTLANYKKNKIAWSNRLAKLASYQQLASN